MVEKIITYAILGLVLSLTFRYMNKLSRKQIPLDDSGKTRLRMSKLYNVIGYSGIAFGVLIVVGPLIFVKEDPDGGYFLFLFVFLLMSGLGTYSVMCYRNHVAVFDDTAVEVSNAFGKTNVMKWQEMTKISFNPFSGFITIKGRDDRSIKLHYHLIGIAGFVDKLRERTGLESKILERHFRD